MAEIELLMPEMGESVTDATISNWLVSEGDEIQVDQDILEISTDKVDTEVPSPVSGVLIKILHQPGSVVEVGKPLAIIRVESEQDQAKTEPVIEKPEPIQEPEMETEQVAISEDELKHPNPPFIPISDDEEVQSSPSQFEDRFYSPLVRSIAESEGITSSELESIQGSGLDGRVTKDDIKRYIANKSQSNSSTQQIPQANQQSEISNAVSSEPLSTSSTSTQSPQISSNENIAVVSTDTENDIVEMDKMRRLIADHMVNSVRTSPHATLFIEADVTNLSKWRDQNKDSFYQREGQKLTFTPLFIEAVTNAIKAYPAINVSVVEQYKIHYKKHINIGMATALPNGNLIVPVVKHCEEKTLMALTKNVNDLANRARNNKLKPDDTQGGTFTLTNIGTFDNLMGTPIINQPQAAILATGAIKKRPVVLEKAEGDVIAIRQMMYLSLTMDHRVIDGALGGAFLKRIVQELEDWDMSRTI